MSDHSAKFERSLVELSEKHLRNSPKDWKIYRSDLRQQRLLTAFISGIGILVFGFLANGFLSMRTDWTVPMVASVMLWGSYIGSVFFGAFIMFHLQSRFNRSLLRLASGKTRIRSQSKSAIQNAALASIIGGSTFFLYVGSGLPSFEYWIPTCVLLGALFAMAGALPGAIIGSLCYRFNPAVPAPDFKRRQTTQIQVSLVTSALGLVRMTLAGIVVFGPLYVLTSADSPAIKELLHAIVTCLPAAWIADAFSQSFAHGIPTLPVHLVPLFALLATFPYWHQRIMERLCIDDLLREKGHGTELDETTNDSIPPLVRWEIHRSSTLNGKFLERILTYGFSKRERRVVELVLLERLLSWKTLVWPLAAFGILIVGHSMKIVTPVATGGLSFILGGVIAMVPTFVAASFARPIIMASFGRVPASPLQISDLALKCGRRFALALTPIYVPCSILFTDFLVILQQPIPALFALALIPAICSFILIPLWPAIIIVVVSEMLDMSTKTGRKRVGIVASLFLIPGLSLFILPRLLPGPITIGALLLMIGISVHLLYFFATIAYRASHSYQRN